MIYEHTDRDGDEIEVTPSLCQPESVVVDVNGACAFADTRALYEALGRHLGEDEAPAKKAEDLTIEDVADVEKAALFMAARSILDPTGCIPVRAEDVALIAGLIAKA